MRALAALYAPDGRLYDPAGGQPVMGRAAIADHFARVPSDPRDPQIMTIAVTGHAAAVHLRAAPAGSEAPDVIHTMTFDAVRLFAVRSAASAEADVVAICLWCELASAEPAIGPVADVCTARTRLTPPSAAAASRSGTETTALIRPDCASWRAVRSENDRRERRGSVAARLSLAGGVVAVIHNCCTLP
jgi:SnoaL-like protein